ncbi:MAG: hypothetical protein WBW48_20200 [Anaerolineae bacterium]
MKGCYSKWWLLTIVALFLIGPVHAAKADQAGVQVFQITQSDLDRDGVPDITTIDCSYATQHDCVYVYDGGHDMRVGNEWMRVTDFVNDTWIFDVGADGTAQLVIRFEQHDGRMVAFFYDDQDGDSRVSYEFNGKNVVLSEIGDWALRVEADGSWLLSDGFPNHNLRFFLSGNTDYWSEIVDRDHDGVPEYEVWNLFGPARSEERTRGPESGMWVNSTNSRPALSTDYIFWPFLSRADRFDDVKKGNKFASLPFVAVDWEKVKVVGISIGKDISGYPTEAGYFMLGWNRWEEGRVNYANFENPMAYYDLADDHDNWPELHIRLEYFGPHDGYLDIGTSLTPMNDIRYSWNQSNGPGLYWNYKISLAGRNQVTSSVWFNDFGIQMVPYQELPAWVSDHTWAWGTLVADEGGGSPSSEGIYEWAATNVVQSDVGDRTTWIEGSQQDLRNYLMGRIILPPPPDQFYRDIRQGMRGEFGYLQDHPYLYFSPIDARLHLRRAIQGVWNAAGNKEIRYANRDDDPYLDEWRYLEDGQLRRQLNAAPGHLILTDVVDRLVLLKRTQTPPSLFEILPPRNHDEWLALGQMLKNHGRSFVPGDFEAMLAQFAGPTTQIEGASMRDFRLTEEGFRFVLELQPGFEVRSDPENLQLFMTEPRAYVLAYDGDRLSVRPLTPASLRAIKFQVGAPEGSVRELEWTSVEVGIGNDGLEDVHDVPVCATFNGPEGQQDVLTTMVALVPGEGSQPVAWDWLPRAAGTWEGRVEAGCGPAADNPVPHQVLATTRVEVERRPTPSLRWLLSLGGRVWPGVVVPFVSITLLAASAAILWALQLKGDAQQEFPESS